MKESEIKIRIDDELKIKFKNKCHSEKTSMSDKLINFIKKDINFDNDNFKIEMIKPIRTNLVKTLLYRVLNKFSFEYSNDLKIILEQNFKENLKFDVTVSEIKKVYGENISYGNVFFNLEDDSLICIDFNVSYNENEKM